MTITCILFSQIGEVMTQPSDTDPITPADMPTDVTESPSGSNNTAAIVGAIILVIVIAIIILVSIGIVVIVFIRLYVDCATVHQVVIIAEVSFFPFQKAKHSAKV